MDKIDFFNLNLSIIKWAGLWLPQKSDKLAVKCRYIIYDVIVIGFTAAFCVPMEWLTLRYSYHNLDELMKIISIAGTHTLAVVKIVVWFYNREELLRITRALQIKAAEYNQIDDFDPIALIKEERKLKDFISRIFLCLGSSVSITAYIPTVWTFLMDYKKFELTTVGYNNETVYRYTQKLPYFIQIPFTHDTSRVRYAFALVYIFIPEFHFAWIIIGLDTLFVSTLSYISVSFKILQGAFRTIRQRCLLNLKMDNRDVLLDSPELSDAMIKEMNSCIAHLQFLFRICERIESINTYLTLMQVLSSQILICACLYMVSAIPITSKAFATELIYLVAVEMEIALYCFFGNKVTLSGEDLGLALYQGDWLSASASFKKSMLITMTRMRRPFCLTIGKFSPLTLATFVTIGRASYSFFAVIKNK